jgi:hypothetical protein
LLLWSALSLSLSPEIEPRYSNKELTREANRLILLGLLGLHGALQCIDLHLRREAKELVLRIQACSAVLLAVFRGNVQQRVVEALNLLGS